MKHPLLKMQYLNTLVSLSYAAILSIFLISLTGCVTRKIPISSRYPAAVFVPYEVKIITSVDRTQYGGGIASSAVDILLQGRTVENSHPEVAQMLGSFQRTCPGISRFSVQVSTAILSGNSNSSIFPDPLPWKVIDSLCATNQSDALMAVEIYSRSFRSMTGERPTTRTEMVNGRSQTINTTEFFDLLITQARVGFRLYDRINRSILDEFYLERKDTFAAVGVTPAEARQRQISPERAFSISATGLGELYSRRISPIYILETREYYHNLNKIPAVKRGSKRLEVGDWNGAIREWEGAIKPGQSKANGRLCINIALAHEQAERLTEAWTWATRGYEEYGNKQSRQYARLLNEKIKINEAATRQLERGN